MTPEEQAAFDAAQDAQIRDLASQIAQMTKLGFDPMTIRKGIIGAVSDSTVPPTVSINISGDSETLITQVRTLNNYTPLVGQTVLVAKQGTEIFLLGSIASGGAAANLTSTTTDDGWIKATLAAGSHNTSGSGDVEYRRVLDHGSWKMQWRGGWTVSGTTIVTALDADYRPSAPRQLVAARDVSDAVAVRVDFNTNGSVTIAGGTTAPGLSIASVSLSYSGGTDTRLSGYLSSGGSDLGHSHGCSGSTSSHVHSGSTVTVAAPGWISLNGLEYFL